MSGSKAGQDEPKGGRTPRAKNTDLTERHRSNPNPASRGSIKGGANKSAPRGPSRTGQRGGQRGR